MPALQSPQNDGSNGQKMLNQSKASHYRRPIDRSSATSPALTSGSSMSVRSGMVLEPLERAYQLLSPPIVPLWLSLGPWSLPPCMLGGGITNPPPLARRFSLRDRSAGGGNQPQHKAFLRSPLCEKSLPRKARREGAGSPLTHVCVRPTCAARLFYVGDLVILRIEDRPRAPRRPTYPEISST